MRLILLLAACSTKTPTVASSVGGVGPAPVEVGTTEPVVTPPTSPEVFAWSSDGTPLLGRVQLEVCAWQVFAPTGNGWGPPIAIAGVPSAALSTAGAVALWSHCEGESLESFQVAASLAELDPATNLASQLPEFVEQVWWNGPTALTVQGRGLSDRVSTIRMFELGADGVTATHDPCVAHTPAPSGRLRRGNESVAVLLKEDLDDDDVDELVLEEPDSCGTARCTATVWTRCLKEDEWRPVGELDHRDGVEAISTTDRGWKRLQSQHGDGVDTWAFDGHTYQSAR